jgi:hypothetical protein
METLPCDGARGSASAQPHRVKEAAMADSDFQAVAISEAVVECSGRAGGATRQRGRHRVAGRWFY